MDYKNGYCSRLLFVSEMFLVDFWIEKNVIVFADKHEFELQDC